MSEEFIKRFKRFLKEEGIYKTFQDNFQPGYLIEQGSDSSSLKSFLETCSIINAVSGAFSWGTTAQGFQFWEHIYCKWANFSVDRWIKKK
jgi:hypothetical protein